MPHYMTPRQGPVEPPTPEQRSRAVRTVAGHARGATDLTRLLDMLGLNPADAQAPVPAQAAPAKGPRHRRLSVAELNALVSAPTR